ncbi:MAG: hypothetical protein RMZ69_34800 [Nostoc sp. ChiQUE01a]|nr:hypothetical protein [Nostoc sp. ChiQUE01a]
MNSKVLSGIQLKRLAEQVIVQKTGKDFWIVTGKDMNLDREIGQTKVFYSLNEANEYLQELKEPNFDVFGPFNNSEEIESTSNKDEWVSILVEFRRNGETNYIHVNPKEIDAMFWSISAFDKFIAPYYTYVYGTKFVSNIREEYIKNIALGQQHGYPSSIIRACPIADFDDEKLGNCAVLPPEEALKKLEIMVEELKNKVARAE